MVILAVTSIATVSALLAEPVVAAESAGAPAAASSEKDAAAATSATPAEKPSAKKGKGEKRAKPRGRLPAYFGSIVTPELREKIYAIQAEYEPKISQLRKEIDALTKAQDEKINALLTPEQKKKIEELKAAAKAPKEKKETSEAKKEPKEKKQSKKAAKAKAATEPAAPK